MKTVIEKLNLKRGASIVIAMVIFLLCALAGASAVLMASTNAGRYSHSNEQQYYMVSSAALMFVDILDGLTYTSDTVKYRYERKWDFTDNKHIETDSYYLEVPQLPLKDKNSVSIGSKLTGGSNFLRTKIQGQNNLKICEMIVYQCDAVVPFLNVPGEWYSSLQGKDGAPQRPEKVEPLTYEFTISLEGQSGGVVNCRLVMDANYNLLLTFDCGNNEYAITIYWKAEVEANLTSENPKYDYVTQDSAGNYTSGSVSEQHTLVVTAKWRQRNITISRGGAI